MTVSLTVVMPHYVRNKGVQWFLRKISLKTTYKLAIQIETAAPRDYFLQLALERIKNTYYICTIFLVCIFL